MNFTEETKHALDEWLAKWGATVHPDDEERFYKFALTYCADDRNEITKKEFVKVVKKYTYTSTRHNRGIAQKFYYKLETIKSFCQANHLFQ